MRRHRRFPIISVFVVLGLVASVVMLSMTDNTIPQMALGKVGSTVSGMGSSLAMLASVSGENGGLFSFGGASGNPWTASAALPMLVNAENPVPEGYVPINLVRMREYCDPQVVTIKEDGIDGQRDAVDALMGMLRAAIEQGVGNWQISAGYRSVGYQQTVWDEKVNEYLGNGLNDVQAQLATSKYVAKPGCSEHHTGLAFDVTVPGESFPLTDQSKWLAENCWDYGFIIRYTEEKVEITGINAEPWHIRYVGLPHAKTMRDGNMCLEEYIAGQDKT